MVKDHQAPKFPLLQMLEAEGVAETHKLAVELLRSSRDPDGKVDPRAFDGHDKEIAIACLSHLNGQFEALKLSVHDEHVRQLAARPKQAAGVGKPKPNCPASKPPRMQRAHTHWQNMQTDKRGYLEAALIAGAWATAIAIPFAFVAVELLTRGYSLKGFFN